MTRTYCLSPCCRWEEDSSCPGLEQCPRCGYGVVREWDEDGDDHDDRYWSEREHAEYLESDR
jgi:hypothetical protein